MELGSDEPPLDQPINMEDDAGGWATAHPPDPKPGESAGDSKKGAVAPSGSTGASAPEPPAPRAPPMLIEYPNKPASHWQNELAEASDNHELVLYGKYIIDMCLQIRNRDPWIGLALPEEKRQAHKDFLKLFVMSNYTKFIGTGVGPLKLTLTTHLFFAFLQLSSCFPASQTLEEQSSKPTQTVEEVIAEIYNECLHCSIDDEKFAMDQWRRRLIKLEQACIYRFVTNFETATKPDPVGLENACRVFSFTFLQLHYFEKYSTSLQRGLGANATELTPSTVEEVKNQLETDWKDFFSRQLSTDVLQRKNNMAYEHWLGCCGLKYQYIRKHASSSVTVKSAGSRQVASMINEMLPKQLRDDLKKGMAMDARELVQFIGGNSTLNGLQDMMNLASLTVLINTRMTVELWFKRYFMSSLEFFEHHAKLLESKRHLVERRPIVFPLLGRWGIVTHDMRLWTAPNAFEAIVLWKAILIELYDSKLEDDLS